MKVSRPSVSVGLLVRVRRQRWRVSDIRPYQKCQLLTLVGAETSNAGLERAVLTPFDVVEPIEAPSGFRIVGPLRWRKACRSVIADDGPPAMLRTAPRAGIELLPHQLEPALAIVAGLGTRVLIADDVGLGKTIQAGLVLSELRARGAAERILILTPAGLRDQWQEELANRFELSAAVVGMHELRRQTRTLPPGINPWSTFPVVIASVDFAKRPEVLPDILACRWDIVVLDEVHGVAPETDRHAAAAVLCSTAPYVLLLTATPHSGDTSAFESLCRLGRVETDVPLVFRRTRRQVGLGVSRRIHRLLVRPTSAERRMHEALAQLTLAIRRERGDGDRGLWLAVATLHKRALSSARSLERSVVRRLAMLTDHPRGDARQPSLPFDDGNGELEHADLAPLWTSPALSDVAEERTLLAALAEAARAAIGQETKLAALGRLLRRLRARHEQVIVFTEYRDTLFHVRNVLPYECALLHGGMKREERRTAIGDFSSGRRAVLLATDAAGEGLNLQDACRVVVNLELPWNPVRLEQRAGRVDRIGQRRNVHAFHLVARDTGEIHVLRRLEARIAKAREAIDMADPLNGNGDEDEQEAARLVIGCGPSGFNRREPDVGQDQVYARLSLASEAAAEHSRLLRSRAFAGPAESPPLGAPGSSLVAFARRHEIRTLLGSRWLVIVRTILEDTCGRVVASRLTPLLVRLENRVCRSAAREAIARIWWDLQRAALACARQSTGPQWHDAVQAHGRFWQTRIDREAAIATAVRHAADPVCQPGLFDRRAIDLRLASARHEQEFFEDIADRQTLFHQMAATVVPDARIALVLVP